MRPTAYDTVVIGAGLAGLTAALRLAETGQRVAVLAKGVGATHLSPATIDVLGYDDGVVESPAQALPGFADAHSEHPYGRLSVELLRAALAWFQDSLDGHGYCGGLDENLLVPTAVGVAKPTALVPGTMAAADLRKGGRFVFVGLRGLKDFYPAFLAGNVARAKLPGGVSVATRAIEVVPPQGVQRDLGSLGFARRFEDPRFRATVVAELKQHLVPGEVVGFPAVLGVGRAREVRQELEERLGHAIFEVPTLPPSVQGLRVFETMTGALRRAGGRLVVGSTVGEVRTSNSRVEAVVTETAGRPIAYHAGAFVLATGGFASGGLELESSGRIRETVFDLPLSGVPGPEEPRLVRDYFEDHPISRAGVAVDEKMLAVNSEGEPVYENLHAVGATLAGAVPWREASGNGISLASGYAAAEAILGESS
ncbi:MAG TPA: glycerol-3-phosphate dehydrogenase subunit GlpB [Gaiellaceae bacterium]|nr:glycerol-3-phosphate dehydrogenase subunit GlpB [Gaiellaceae bacterium]